MTRNGIANLHYDFEDKSILMTENDVANPVTSPCVGQSYISTISIVSMNNEPLRDFDTLVHTGDAESVIIVCSRKSQLIAISVK
jgi:hypothetical protein